MLVTTCCRLIFVSSHVQGGPGVGKGTLCASLIEKFNYCHLGVGDLLREEQNTPGSVFSEFIAKCISNSVIVPPSLTMLLLKERIQQAQSRGQGVLVDGFPRSVGQALAFEREVRFNIARHDYPS